MTGGQPLYRVFLSAAALACFFACGEEPKDKEPDCVLDSECAAGQHCQVALGTCHECTTDEHCDNGACISLACVARDPDAGNNGVDPDADGGDLDVPDDADLPDTSDVPEDGGDVPPDVVGQACDPACPGIQVCNDETERCQERSLCLGDADCIGDRVCFRNACSGPNEALAAGGCLDDDSCVNQGQRLYCDSPSHTCRPLGLCRDSGECPGALACTGDGLCVECISAAQCAGGLSCDDSPGANYCVEPGTCGTDADCRGDRECNDGTCEEPDCTEDDFDAGQGNDKCSDATEIGEGSWELQICEDNCDWFAVEIQEGDGFVARVLHEPADGDLDLELYQGACGGQGPERIARSATEGPAEVVRIARSFEHATYRLRVCPFIRPGDGGTNSYRLDTVVVSDGFCVEDVYDDNASNDVAARASNISVTSRPFDFESPALQICPGSDDWFRVELQAGDFLTVQTSFLHRFGDLRLELYEGLPGEGSMPVAVSDSDDDGELVSLVVERNGEFFLRVWGGENVQNEYDLAIRVGGGCVDAFEPTGDSNNTSQTATSLTGLLPGEFVGLRLCEDDEDWFSLNVPSGMAAVLTAEYDENLGVDLNADVHRTMMAPAATRGSGGVLNVVAEAPNGGGEVKVRLFRDNETDVIYTLRVELRRLDDLCQDAQMRGNYRFADAFEAEFGVREYLGTVCPGVTQYFSYSVPAGHQMFAELLNVSEPGALEVEILGTNERVLGAGEPGEYGPVATYTAQGQTETVVAVRGVDGDAAASYLLQAYAHPGGPGCGEDEFEESMGDENDTWGTARLVSGGTWIRNLVGCPADEDWYKFFVISGSNISVTIQSHSPAAGALQAIIWDVDGPEFGLVAAMGQTENGSLTLNVNSINVLFGGQWSVQIFGETGDPVFYDLRVITN